MQKKFADSIQEIFSVKPEDSAEMAALEYVSDTQPGYKKRKHGKGFVIVDDEGKPVKDNKVLSRISSLVIPPAWTEVWISKKINGHIQVTGRDTKGRKQYIYHPKWEEIRNQGKFTRIIRFAETLPVIRKRIDIDLRKHNLPREKVLAMIIRLLEETLIRIGNQEYAANGSFGLTTLMDEHLISEGTKIQLVFKGKSGKNWEVDILNKKLARLIKKCQELPGQELFQYIDEEGNIKSVSSTDVNAYLCGIIGEEFSAKDFRTWGGTVLMAKELYLLGQAESENEAKRNITKAIKNVSKALNNTPAICRDYYIHPSVIEGYRDGSLFKLMNKTKLNGKNIPGLSKAESGVLKLLKQKQAKSL